MSASKNEVKKRCGFAPVSAEGQLLYGVTLSRQVTQRLAAVVRQKRERKPMHSSTDTLMAAKRKQVLNTTHGMQCVLVVRTPRTIAIARMGLSAFEYVNDGINLFSFFLLMSVHAQRRNIPWAVFLIAEIMSHKTPDGCRESNKEPNGAGKLQCSRSVKSTEVA